MEPTADAAELKAEALDPVNLVLESSGVVLSVVVLLMVAATGVWVIWVLKTMQIKRLRAAQHRFERATEQLDNASDLISSALEHKAAPGARVVVELGKRHHQRHLSTELMMAVAKRALADESQRASTLMPTLSSIASASPFIGLFGTVWGIMDAFLRIGVEKSASLPVVAPAIAEALIATAVGLFAAIPATIAYNYVDQRIADFMMELESSAESWAQTIASDPGGPSSAVPLVRTSDRPPPQPQPYG